MKTAIANEHWFKEVGQCLKAPQDQVQEDKGDDKRIFSMIGQDAERLRGSYITQPFLCQFIMLVVLQERRRSVGLSQLREKETWKGMHPRMLSPSIRKPITGIVYMQLLG